VDLGEDAQVDYAAVSGDSVVTLPITVVPAVKAVHARVVQSLHQSPRQRHVVELIGQVRNNLAE